MADESIPEQVLAALEKHGGWSGILAAINACDGLKFCGEITEAGYDSEGKPRIVIHADSDNVRAAAALMFRGTCWFVMQEENA